MQKFTRFICASLLLLLASGANAQTNIANYTYAQATSTFTPISSDTLVFTGSYDDTVTSAISMGGGFTFGGVTYSQCYISSNGFIAFGAAPATTTYSPLSTLGSTTGAIAAFGADGASSTVAGATSRVSYASIGNEFIVQYLDHATYSGRSTERVNFQIRLNKATNTISFVYGTFAAPGSTYTPQVGIRGSSTTWATNVNNLLLPNIPAGTSCNWSNAVTGNSNSSGLLYSTANTGIVPPANLIYTWAPSTAPAPVRTFYAVSNITTTGAKISWAPASGATQYNVQYRTLGACSWTDFSGNPVTDTTATLTGLAVGTTYQVRIQTIGAGGNAIWSHIPTSAGGTGTNGYVAAGPFTTSVPCPIPTAITVGSITSTTAAVSFTSSGSSFIVEYGASGFTPGTGATAGTGGRIITSTTSPVSITGLTPSTAYQVYVRQNCTGAGNGYSNNSSVVSFTTLAPPPPNDLPSGAISLIVGGDCTGAPYTNVGGTFSTGEPAISCKGLQTAGAIVWFKFKAPASGFVRVSTDVTGNGLTDTKIGLFSATDSSILSTFQIIACDDDNGVVLGNASILYATGLVAGQTYYVAVDHYNGTLTGSFCVQVHEMTTAMLSPSGSCTSGQSSYNLAAYTGQVSLTDNAGLLIANIKPNAALTSDPGYSPYLNVNTGAVRHDTTGKSYLDRNYRITNAAAGNYSVQFFFLNTELARLQTVSPTTVLTNLNATKVKNETACNANFVSGGAGNDSLLTQTSSGTALGISWVNFTTPGFSNFYVHSGTTPLPIRFEYLTGKKAGSTNALNWKVSCTSTSITMVLERSADARAFKDVVTSITATQARCGQPFDAVDAAPINGISYYRLKMIDVDGTVSYSPVAAVLNGKAGAELVGIYPTVVKDQAYLSVTSSRNTTLQFSISDMSGKVITTLSQSVSSGSSMLPVNTSHLASGVYNITGLLDGVRTQTLRFVKQ